MRPKPRAFTLVELLVVIGIIALLIGILLPVLGRARDASRVTACMANLRSIGQATVLYANDFDDAVLPSVVNGATGDDYWPLLLQARKYLPKSSDQDPNSTGAGSKSVLICPSVVDAPSVATGSTGPELRRATSVAVAPAGEAEGQAGPLVTQWSYGINGSPNAQTYTPSLQLPCRAMSYKTDGSGQGGNKNPPQLRRAQLPEAAHMAFIFDGAEGNWFLSQQNADTRITGSRHGKWDPAKAGTTGLTNVLFFDGHVETLARNELPNGGNVVDTIGMAATPPAGKRLSQLWPKARWRVDANF